MLKKLIVLSNLRKYFFSFFNASFSLVTDYILKNFEIPDYRFYKTDTNKIIIYLKDFR